MEVHHVFRRNDKKFGKVKIKRLSEEIMDIR